jgi:hypothetical protein
MRGSSGNSRIVDAIGKRSEFRISKRIGKGILASSGIANDDDERRNRKPYDAIAPAFTVATAAFSRFFASLRKCDAEYKLPRQRFDPHKHGASSSPS